ncbi:MAG: hypothetical protein M1820_010439, partial [Bogoriella megaspora]
NVTDVALPYGGYTKFITQGLNDKYLPVWMQEAGYATYYIGKLMNVHNVTNYDTPFAAGYNGSDFLLDPYQTQYYNSTWVHNHDTPVNYPGEYLTDLLMEKTFASLDDAVVSNGTPPFFMVIAPTAPHSETTFPTNGPLPVLLPPHPATKYKNYFQNVTVPRAANFNPDHPSGVFWIRDLPQQNASVVAANDEFYRNRLRTLQSVDEMVDNLFTRLQDHKLLDNTYVIYTTDNGFHIGQHRLPPGKACGYEEDINIPLVIRGPGTSSCGTVDVATTHTDLAPTIFGLAGIEPRKDFDGQKIPITETEIALANRDAGAHEHVSTEYWGVATAENPTGGADYPGPDFRPANFNSTYKGVRIINDRTGYNLYYRVWCNNDHEIYDMNTDPGQLDNLWLIPNATLLGFPLYTVVTRLDALLMILKSCTADTCRWPWRVLHPAGNVHNLAEALKPQNDDYYTMEMKARGVNFSHCAWGYIIDAEGPQVPLVYDGMS